MRYLCSRSTDFDKIRYDDASEISQPEGIPKISKFQNPRWQTAAILKIEKLRYIQNRLANFAEILYDNTY